MGCFNMNWSIHEIQQFFQRRLVAQIISALLLLLLLNECFRDVWNFWVIAHPPAVDLAQPVLKTNALASQSLIQKQLSQPLFGDYLPARVNDLNVKPSNLNISLVGVLFSAHPEESQMLIALADGQALIYHQGELMPGEVKIKKITPDGVVLEHDGELESLSLPKNELQFEAPAKALVED